jgi:GTP-binding protein
LGHRFLRHIERNSMLLFMVPCDSKDIRDEYHILLSELEKYNPEMLDKQRLLVITKSDLLDEELKEEIILELPQIKYLFISSVANVGLVTLNDDIWKMLTS